MDRWITNAKFAFLALFLVASLGTVAYQAIYVWPMERCENKGAWWDPKDRQCLIPIPIWRITNRKLAAYGFKPGSAAPIADAAPDSAPPVSASPPAPTARPPRPAR